MKSIEATQLAQVTKLVGNELGLESSPILFPYIQWVHLILYMGGTTSSMSLSP